MKLLPVLVFLFFFTTVSATNYYISSSGNDLNSGLTTASSWKTLSKINSSSFSPGDIISLKCGDTWREQLTLHSSGTSVNKITFNSYGTGNKPRILGSELANSWTNISGNIWKSVQTFTDPYTLSSYKANIYFVETNGNVCWGRVKKANTGLCIAEYDWTWATNHIYIYSKTDPNTRYSGVEISQRRISIRTMSKEYITIDGLEIAYTGNYGIGEMGSEANVNGLTVKNCHIHHIGTKSSGMAYGIESFYSDALIQNNEIHDSGRRNISLNLYEGTAMHDIIVEGNNLYNGFHTTGIDISSLTTGTIRNVTIRKNYIHENLTTVIDNVETYGSALIYCANDGSGSVSNVYIYDNILKGNTGKAIALGAIGGPTSCYISNNTIYGVSPHITSTYTAMIQIEHGSIAVIKNNILYNDVNISTNPTYSVVNITSDAGTVTLDNNLYYNTSATRLIGWYGTSYSVAQWAAYKTASGQDVHSIATKDPLFVSSSDYNLKTGSPGIDAGVDLEITTDYNGRSIVGLPDIGAYEYGSSSGDTEKPTVTGFNIPSTSTSQTVSITLLTATDNIGVTGYLLTETSFAPYSNATSWSATKPTTYVFSTIGSKTLYVWAKDAAGNVSASRTASVLISSPIATTFTFTGPALGNVNSTSANFTVTPNNSYTGTITITPTGTGSTGLAARVLNYSNSSAAQTFTLLPTIAGSITLTPTNSDAITNPVSLAYTANAVSPGAPTSVVATAGDARASVIFATPANSSGSAITGYTVSSLPLGGIDMNAGSTSLSHSITGLTNGASYTFTVKATNSAGASIASAASNAVIPLAPVATSFTFAGPSVGNVNSASANFTVTPNNSYTGTITITPTGAGSTGLVARVLNYSNSSAAQTFTLLPTIAGSITLTPTNNGAITNPVSLAYTANAVVPGAPTSVVATAGDTRASLTFAAPANNGGSAITGYTVTSIPAGGTDTNAGSTSHAHSITGLTNGTSYSFTVKATNSAGVSIASIASNAVIPLPPVATTFTLSGPSGGNVNSASAIFTVTPNKPYTGTITITPSGAGSTGIAARVLNYSNSAVAQTFTILPATAGSITLTPTNNGAITNPGSLAYTANAVSPGAPASVVAAAGDATASVTFATPANNGGSAITGYTVTSIPAGGTDLNAGSTSLTHSITGLTNGTSYTFTVKATNSAGASIASIASNAVIPLPPVATTFTLSGPSGGNVNSASANFTVTPNNSYTGKITITPTGAGSTGLVARVLTYSNSAAAQTFTILPTTAGSITLTPTNNGAITNPVSLAYTANAVSPGAPASIVATAGDARASVTFAAPANNGGSAITGYTVTSLPAGGTDLNAGSTSFNHSITGLTNGTSYTFTVKATNSAGASIFSAASNAVIPTDVTIPVISAFTIPSTSNSRTVSISRLTATDNNGITGYLLTETAAVPSTGTSGWTSAAPSTYSFSSDGCKALYAWVKDAAGNVSALRYEVVIITSNLTAEPDAHFKTVWQGENGQNHMNINVISATLEGMPLSVDDEIALFSGADCVGTLKLKKSINSTDQSTFITLQASQEDGSNNGFADNDTIIFKIWDSKNQLEIRVNSVTYKKDITSWITSGKYVPGATSTVEIEASTGISQTIVLKKGYNLISTYLNANYPDVTSVTKSLYDQGNLVKLQDESGNSFENWGTYGSWINKIGTFENTEGYKIQVANNCTLQVTGKPVALPMDIPLKTGWNIISFPYTNLVNAKSVIQSLIDQNRLSKVQDEEGNSIENWGQFGGWINGIGNFAPGKGYKVKVVANAMLRLQQSDLKSVVIQVKSEKAVHFTTSIEGNGTDHMNINIVGLQASGISVGDELAAYDGKICVGTLKINENNTESASLVVSFSSSEQAGDGFIEGHPIDLLVWNRITDSEKVVHGEVISGKLSYLKNSSVMLKLKTPSFDVKSLEDAIKIDLSPNPSTGIVTVRFSEMPVTESRIDIVDISGRLILSRQITNIAEVFNLENQVSGIYLVKIKTGSNQHIHKLIVTK